ncbi:MAG TPA: hypothetical protein VFK13_13780 [Gemmatimonadaceae bacterium]|nr:hypothetical protein [Gemmatimonadaceae bacterium]
MRSTVLALVLASAAGAALVSCGPPSDQPPGLRFISPTYRYTVTSDPSPPHAREPVKYKVVVRDRKSGQPVEAGEGRIFAQSAQGPRTWDGFRTGTEVGTYYGTLNFVTSGSWAIAVQFRRDSLQPLERIDWMQDVFAEREAPGESIAVPTSTDSIRNPAARDSGG